MNEWVIQLGLSSAGLLVLAVIAWLLLLSCRKDPATGYRVVVLVLLLAAVMPLAQWSLFGSQSTPLSSPPTSSDVAVDVVASPPIDAATVEPGGPSEPLSPPASLAPGTLAPLAKVANWVGQVQQSLPTGRLAPAILLVGYLIGAGLVLSFTLVRLVRASRLLAHATPVVHEPTLTAWRRIVASRPSAADTELLCSHELSTPACLGLLRRRIVMPAGVDLPREEGVLDSILHHELVHLERQDALIALLSSLVGAAFWFHPAAWWLARRLDNLREPSCDQLAVRRTGDRRRYARSLLRFAEVLALDNQKQPSTLLVSWSRSGSHLQRRIEMLIGNRPPSVSRRLLTGLLGAALLAPALAGQLLAATLVPEPTAVEVVAGSPGPALQQPTRLGIEIGEVDPALAAQVGRDAGEIVLVNAIEKGSPADRAGVRRLDVITHVNENRVDLDRLTAAKQSWDRGQDLALIVMRGGRPYAIEIPALVPGPRVERESFTQRMAQDPAVAAGAAAQYRRWSTVSRAAEVPIAVPNSSDEPGKMALTDYQLNSAATQPQPATNMPHAYRDGWWRLVLPDSEPAVPTDVQEPVKPLEPVEPVDLLEPVEPLEPAGSKKPMSRWL